VRGELSWPLSRASRAQFSRPAGRSQRAKSAQSGGKGFKFERPSRLRRFIGHSVGGRAGCELWLSLRLRSGRAETPSQSCASPSWRRGPILSRQLGQAGHASA